MNRSLSDRSRTARATVAVGLVTGLAGLTGATAAATSDAVNGDVEPATYRVAVENLATGFQPLSPAGVVIHDRSADVWSVGEPASEAVAGVAEDAQLAAFVDAFDGVDGVYQSFVGGDGPFGPGAVSEFEFEARPGQLVSMVAMLVNTNDAFTGLDAVRLTGGTTIYEVDAYDAGTEANDELATSIPGPAGGYMFSGTDEDERIAAHPGIAGVGDLDADEHGWDDPVARITIERID